MAKMKKPVGDLVSGKLGNVVFVRFKGQNYVRTAPNRKNAEWSELQLLYRKRLSNIAALWRLIKSDIIRTVWNSLSTEVNGYANFIKTNMPALEIDGTLITPMLLQVTQGKLPFLSWLTAIRSENFPDYIDLNWDNDTNLKSARLNDRIMAITYNDAVFSQVIDTGLKRKDKSGKFLLPVLPDGPNLTLFIFVASDDLKTFSSSQSFYIHPKP